MAKVYLGIGAQKAGTSSLFNILHQHPDINCATVKESRFFYKDELYEKGSDFYFNHFFGGKQQEGPYLDIDPDFMYFDYIPKRIYETLGDQVRFIVVLRDPAKRAFSAFQMEQFRGNESLDFETAIAAEPERLKTPKGNLFNSYINRGRYRVQIERYFKYFPPEYFRFFIFEEDFLNNRAAMIRSICEFMEVPYPEGLELDQKVNSGKVIKNKTLHRLVHTEASSDSSAKRLLKKVLPTSLRKTIGRNYMSLRLALRKRLIRMNTASGKAEQLSEVMRQELINTYFAEEIKAIESLLGRDLSIWK